MDLINYKMNVIYVSLNLSFNINIKLIIAVYISILNFKLTDHVN